MSKVYSDFLSQATYNVNARYSRSLFKVTIVIKPMSMTSLHLLIALMKLFITYPKCIVVYHIHHVQGTPHLQVDFPL